MRDITFKCQNRVDNGRGYPFQQPEEQTILKILSWTRVNIAKVTVFKKNVILAYSVTPKLMHVTRLGSVIDSHGRLPIVLLGSEVTFDNWDDNEPRQW